MGAVPISGTWRERFSVLNRTPQFRQWVMLQLPASKFLPMS